MRYDDFYKISVQFDPEGLSMHKLTKKMYETMKNNTSCMIFFDKIQDAETYVIGYYHNKATIKANAVIEKFYEIHSNDDI